MPQIVLPTENVFFKKGTFPEKWDHKQLKIVCE